MIAEQIRSLTEKISLLELEIQIQTQHIEQLKKHVTFLHELKKAIDLLLEKEV